jgi:geranylgeranyl diphosphate synthase type II
LTQSGLSLLDETAFLDKLSSYRERAWDTLREFLPGPDQERFLYGLVWQQLELAGKGLRPALCLATCSAFGGRSEDAVNTAAALELLHNAFLVHDDIEDGSEFRRDQPTMHVRHGVPLAVNAGDAMQALTMRMLKGNLGRLGPDLTYRVLEEFDHMLIRSLEGQALELGWIRENRLDITDEDYYRLILKKTCWYSFIHPCRLGALIAEPEDRDLDRFNAFGFYLGAAFQIQDDVLNLVGSRSRYGKEIGGDLYEGKRTLILAHTFGQCTKQEKARLSGFLEKPRARRMPREIDNVYELLGKYGSIDFARGVANELLGAATAAFEVAYADAPDSEYKAFVHRLLRYVVDRDV